MDIHNLESETELDIHNLESETELDIQKLEKKELDIHELIRHSVNTTDWGFYGSRIRQLDGLNPKVVR